jgi:uncharacterized membrane protein YqiK
MTTRKPTVVSVVVFLIVAVVLIATVVYAWYRRFLRASRRQVLEVREGD